MAFSESTLHHRVSEFLVLQHRGFVVERVVPHGVILTKPLPLVIKVPTSADMVAGERLACYSSLAM